MLKGRAVVFVLTLFTISVLVSFILFHPNIRKVTQKFFVNQDREVLSSLEAHLGEHRYKIVKLRDSKGLLVEVYLYDDETNEIIFVDRDYLTDKKDAFYKINNENLNLFLKDINDDKSPEIILPSFDKNMVAHLNIYSFDTYNQKLIKLSSH